MVLGALEKPWQYIWSSYYKRMQRMARAWDSPKCIWSSYYKRIGSDDAFEKDKLDTLVIISVSVNLTPLDTLAKLWKRIWSSNYKRIVDLAWTVIVKVLDVVIRSASDKLNTLAIISVLANFMVLETLE